MKITFVYPDVATNTPRPWTGRYYCGIGYLSACLKRAGFQTSLIHLTTQPLCREEVLARLKAEEPDLVAFSATSHAFPDISTIIGWMREAGMDFPTVCGGVHPTLNPEQALSTPGLEYVCVGEAEEALVELCAKLNEGRDPHQVANIWSQDRGKVYRNAPRPLIHDLDSVPFPDREVFDYPKLYHQQDGEAEIITSRGCPYRCTYCCNQALRAVMTTGKDYVRFRSVDNVIAEIQDLVRRYPFIRFIQFDDDLPFVKLEWTREFSEKYRQLVNLPFRFNLRPNLAHRTTLQLLKEANAYDVKIGLESGNERIMNEVLNRNLTADQIRNAFAACREAGIRTWSLNMVGLPYETPRQILDTVKLNAEIRSDTCQVSIFHPYRGTPLWDLCQEQGFITDKKVPDFFSGSVLNMPSVSCRQITFYQRYFRFLVYFYRILYGLPALAKKPLIRVADTLLASRINTRFFGYVLGPLARIKRKLVFSLQSAHRLSHESSGGR